jgi:hypothetical protein
MCFVGTGFPSASLSCSGNHGLGQPGGRGLPLRARMKRHASERHRRERARPATRHTSWRLLPSGDLGDPEAVGPLEPLVRGALVAAKVVHRRVGRRCEKPRPLGFGRSARALGYGNTPDGVARLAARIHHAAAALPAQDLHHRSGATAVHATARSRGQPLRQPSGWHTARCAGPTQPARPARVACPARLYESTLDQKMHRTCHSMPRTWLRTHQRNHSAGRWTPREKRQRGLPTHLGRCT